VGSCVYCLPELPVQVADVVFICQSVFVLVSYIGDAPEPFFLLLLYNASASPEPLHLSESKGLLIKLWRLDFLLFDELGRYLGQCWFGLLEGRHEEVIGLDFGLRLFRGELSTQLRKGWLILDRYLGQTFARHI